MVCPTLFLSIPNEKVRLTKIFVSLTFLLMHLTK